MKDMKSMKDRKGRGAGGYPANGPETRVGGCRLFRVSSVELRRGRRGSFGKELLVFTLLGVFDSGGDGRQISRGS